MSKLSQLLESSHADYQSIESKAAKLASKWGKTGLLEGLGSEKEKGNMAMILENQAKQLLTENSQVTGGTAAFTTGTGENWAGIALPLVRKVFGQIASKEFVSVQPMNLPAGLVFFLDFQYGTTKAPFTSGDSLYGSGSIGTDDHFGNTNTGGLYGAGRFGYSTNNTSSYTTVVHTASADWFADMQADGEYSASIANYSKYAVNLSAIQYYDTDAIRSFTVSGSSGSTIAVSSVLPQFTRISGSQLVFVALDNLSSTSLGITVNYTKATADNRRGDFEDQATAAISIPEINIKMSSEAIVAKTKKLKAVWTPEFSQDIDAYQNLDAEAELTNIMSEYISLEIDLEILDMLIKNASAGTEYWTAVNNQSINSSGIVNSNLAYYNSQGQWFQTLGTKINKLSNTIHQRTLRGGANFLVCAPSVATVLEAIPGYATNSTGDVTKASYAMGVQKAASINNVLTVYKNPYMTENTILLGYRGGQFLEAGAVFAPYVGVIMTPIVYDPDTLTPRKGLMTRFAKKMVRPEFYGKIYVSGLNTI